MVVVVVVVVGGSILSFIVVLYLILCFYYSLYAHMVVDLCVIKCNILIYLCIIS